MKYHPAANIFPLMQGAEYQALCDDITDHGLHEPILVYEGSILDGRNRHRACIDAGIEPRFREWDGNGSAVNMVVSMNLHRRHLNPGQLAFVALEVEKVKAVQAKERQRGGQGGVLLVSNLTQAKGRARDQAAAMFGVSTGYVQEAKKLNAEAPDLAEKVKAGEVKLWEATQEAKKRVREAAREEAIATAYAEVREDFGVIHGDFRECDLADESVDMVFTDPPYDKTSVPLYGDMAALAARVLRPGGSLITYAGHYALPDIFPLMTPHLTYHWIIGCIHSGASAQVPGKNVTVGWKPLLWFTKGARMPNGYVKDRIDSEPDKRFHEWGQGVVDAAYYIEHLSIPGGTILDPFCGGGTTCAAAMQAGRRYIAYEIDADTAVMARKRIKETTQ